MLRNCGVLFQTQLTSLSLSLALCEIGTTCKCLRWRKYIRTCVHVSGMFCSGLTSLLIFFVISRRCVFVTGWSMLTFIVLPHWSVMSLTFDMIPQQVLALPRKPECQVRCLTTLECRGLGSNPWPPVPRSGYSTDWATEACYASDMQCINHLCFALCFAMSCL